jgi:hypothetical protein
VVWVEGGGHEARAQVRGVRGGVGAAHIRGGRQQAALHTRAGRSVFESWPQVVQQVRVKCTNLAERRGAEGSGGAERQPSGRGPHAAGALATPNAKPLPLQRSGTLSVHGAGTLPMQKNVLLLEDMPGTLHERSRLRCAQYTKLCLIRSNGAHK